MADIKYRKTLLFILSFVAAYALFYGNDAVFHDSLTGMGYLGIFVAGIFFAYGFTAVPATAALLILAGQNNILLAGLIGGMGALAGDILIFRFVRYSLAHELEKLPKKRVARAISPVKKYIAPAVACIIIASPLPDELGVSLLASSRKISPRVFMSISYTLNTAGIFIILMIGGLI